MTVGPRTALASFFYVKWYTAKQNGDLKCAALASHRHKNKLLPTHSGKEQASFLIRLRTTNAETQATSVPYRRETLLCSHFFKLLSHQQTHVFRLRVHAKMIEETMVTSGIFDDLDIDS